MKFKNKIKIRRHHSTGKVTAIDSVYRVPQR